LSPPPSPCGNEKEWGRHDWVESSVGGADERRCGARRWLGAGGSQWWREKKERKRGEGEKMVDKWACRHVASTSSKLAPKLLDAQK
jgi:hypothetical protein